MHGFVVRHDILRYGTALPSWGAFGIAIGASVRHVLEPCIPYHRRIRHTIHQVYVSGHRMVHQQGMME